MAQWLTNPARNHQVAGSIPGPTEWVKDLALLCLWCRPATVAPIRPVAWEPPCAAGAALKTNKQTNKQTNKKKKRLTKEKKRHTT